MVWASKCAWFLAVWLSLTMLHGVGAQVGAPSPSMDCNSALYNLVDCVTFAEEGSKLTKPQGQCCSGLKKVIKGDLACLCETFEGNPDIGANPNMTKAKTLPAACGISTPPLSKCKISGGPGAAPAPNPIPGGPSASGSVSVVPAPSPAHSGARALPVPSFVLVAAAAVALLCYYS